MSVFDWAFNQFLYFRLGNTALTPNFCHFVEIDSLASVEGGQAKQKKADLKKLPSTEISSLELDNTQKAEDRVRICVISDTHERHRVLGSLPSSADILIHSGDILMTTRFISKSEAIRKYSEFNEWLGCQNIPNIIVIGGNHDMILETLADLEVQNILTNATYLCNSSAMVMGLHIWGSPASVGASGNAAFQSKQFIEMTERAANDLINSTHIGTLDILVTHGICQNIADIVRPKIAHISGHYHARHGVFQYSQKRQWVNVAAPIMNGRYNPHNLPIVFDVPKLPEASRP